MDMIEKVAVAIATALGEGMHYNSPGYQAAARAAIEAMRWPTPEMMEAGAEEFKIMNVESFTQDVWDAMIDAALKATPASE